MQEMPTIRICVRINKDEDYLSGEARLQREFDALVPLLDKYGVRLGIQNHCGRNVTHAMGLRSLIAKYDPRHVAAVWDAAHNALQGEDPDLALDIVWSHLCMVNLKNAYWKRMTGPEAEVARWHWYWTNGRQGLASWPKVADELKKRDYSGVVCLTAEYSDHDSVNRLIVEDLAFAKELLGG
jgi:sugar phosphate isomerase/epimerase